jgi:GT2 family glycosyltransferase
MRSENTKHTRVESRERDRCTQTAIRERRSWVRPEIGAGSRGCFALLIAARYKSHVVLDGRSPALAIVTVTFNAAAFVGPFLDALAAVPDTEIAVIDNASADGTATLVRARLPQATLLESPQNLGFAAGSNRGATLTRAPVLLFINPDTRFAPEAPAHLAAAVRDPRVGAAGCKLVFPDGRIQSAGGVLGANGFAAQRGWGELDRGQFDAPAAVDYVPGAALAIRRSVFEEVGGFHPGYFPGFYEDAELCWRLRRHGYEVRYVPEPAIVHLESLSMRPRLDYWLHRNRMLFLVRNPDAWAGLGTEGAWLVREHIGPLARALVGAHPWKLGAAWRRLRPVLAGELAGLALAARTRRPPL